MNSKRTNPIWFVEKDKLQQIVNESKLYSEILIKLEQPCNASTYSILYRKLEEDQIDCSHIPRGCGAVRKGKKFESIKSLDELLVCGSKIKGCDLKKRLIREGVLKNECIICGTGDIWNGKPIVHQLDHINGDHTDNRFLNLRILCGNCHSQCDTYCGRNRKTYQDKLAAIKMSQVQL